MVVRFHYSEDNPYFEINSCLTKKSIAEFDSTLDCGSFVFTPDDRIFLFFDSVISPTSVMEIGMIAYGVGVSIYIDYFLPDEYIAEFCVLLRSCDDCPF